MDTRTQCKTVKLNDGRHDMPLVGLGTFQGAYSYESVDDLVKSAVGSAVDLGYRMFDTASIYNTEKPLGEALRAKIKARVVKREELFIVSKLWCTFHKKDAVAKSLQITLDNLGMDYVDLYLVHWPISMPASDDPFPTDESGVPLFNDEQVSLEETWKGMEECVKLGLAKSIGISNFNKRQIMKILESCHIKPAVNQVESHPYFANSKLIEFCQQNDIHVTCYSPMGKPSRPWAKAGDPVVQSDPVLINIGKKYGKLPGQVALRYQIQRNNSVVPKSSNSERQKQNIAIFDFELSDEDMATVRTLDLNFRMVFLKEKLGASKEYPFNDEF